MNVFLVGPMGSGKSAVGAATRASARPGVRRQRRRDRGPHRRRHPLHLRTRGRSGVPAARGGSHRPADAGRRGGRRDRRWRGSRRAQPRAPAHSRTRRVSSDLGGTTTRPHTPQHGPAAAEQSRSTRDARAAVRDARAAVPEVAEFVVDTDGRKVRTVVQEICVTLVCPKRSPDSMTALGTADERRVGSVSPATPPDVLRIDLGERSYPILIGGNLLEDATLMAQHLAARDVLVVTNTTVGPAVPGAPWPRACGQARAIRRRCPTASSTRHSRC